VKKEFIVHIGLNKTGTTSLQTMMYKSAETLFNNGIYYPTINSNHDRFLRSLFMRDPTKQPANLRAGLKSKKQVKKLNEKFKSILENHITNPKINKIIFSGEVLATLAKKEIGNFANWLAKYSSKTTILCCTRNPISWYNSQVQQSLKIRSVDIVRKCNDICANMVNAPDQRVKN